MGKIQGIAGQASEGVYLAQIQLKFSERDERDVSLPEMLQMTRGRLSSVTDCLVGVFIPSVIGGINSPIQLFLSGTDLTELDGLAVGIQTELETRSGFSDIDTSVREGKPKLRILPRRAVLADVDLPASSLGMALRANVEGLKAGTYKQGDRNYDIVVKFDEEQGKSQVDAFLFPGRPGQSLLLNTFGEVEEMVAPVQILRRDKNRVSRITGNTDASLPLGRAVTEVAGLLEDGRMPAGYRYAFAGDVEYMGEAQEELGAAALTALVLVILTLAAVMESWRHPVLILVTLPLGLIGMVWGLFLFGESFSVFVIVGGVMLIGIVVNNAILITDQFNVHVRAGVPRHQAMIQAAADKFRPIIMITIAAVLGMLPLGLGKGIGAELRNGVGIASAGGILVSGLLTMLVIPVLYDFFTRKRPEKQAKPVVGSGVIPMGLLVLALGGSGSVVAGTGGGTLESSEARGSSVTIEVNTNAPLFALGEAKRVALEGNPGLRAAMARVEAAVAVVRQTRAAYYPILSVEAGAFHNEWVPGTAGGADPYQQYTALARVRWLVFDGFSRRFNLLAAKHGQHASESAKLDAQRLLLQAVSDGYFAALLSQEQARVAEQDAMFNRDLYQETRKRQLAGTAARSDVLNFQMRTLRAENALRVIRLDYETALTALARLVGNEEAVLNVRLDAESAKPRDEVLPPIGESLSYAFAHRPDLDQLYQMAQVGEALTKSQKGAYWPSIGLTAGGGYNATRNSNLFDEDKDTEAFVGVQASWDLFTGGSRRAQVEQIRAQTDALEYQAADRRGQVAQEVRDAMNTFHTASDALINQRVISSLADEIRDIVRREYEVGLAALTRLNEAQTDAVRAAGSLALAHIERARAFESYDSATGRNLVHFRYETVTAER